MTPLVLRPGGSLYSRSPANNTSVNAARMGLGIATWNWAVYLGADFAISLESVSRRAAWEFDRTKGRDWRGLAPIDLVRQLRSVFPRRDTFLHSFKIIILELEHQLIQRPSLILVGSLALRRAWPRRTPDFGTASWKSCSWVGGSRNSMLTARL